MEYCLIFKEYALPQLHSTKYANGNDKEEDSTCM